MDAQDPDEADAAPGTDRAPPGAGPQGPRQGLGRARRRLAAGVQREGSQVGSTNHLIISHDFQVSPNEVKLF